MEKVIISIFSISENIFEGFSYTEINIIPIYKNNNKKSLFCEKTKKSKGQVKVIHLRRLRNSSKSVFKKTEFNILCLVFYY